MPVKPLLFNIALEVLASIIRPKEKKKVWLMLKSLRSGREETKLSLRAGNILFRENPKGPEYKFPESWARYT